jgi:hypothetical protein
MVHMADEMAGKGSLVVRFHNVNTPADRYSMLSDLTILVLVILDGELID